MKEFISTQNKEFYFGDCCKCEAQCCNGVYGSMFSQIILEEFENIYKYFPILFIFGELNYAKAIILLTDGFNACPYLQNNRCSIYEKRPNVCKIYPLSPCLDNKIYIDNCCPQVNPKDTNRSLIIKENKLSEKFQNDIFENYQDKYIKTHFEFDSLNKNDFKKILTIRSVDFYYYNGAYDTKYLKYHKKSLENLNKLFLKK